MFWGFCTFIIMQLKWDPLNCLLLLLRNIPAYSILNTVGGRGEAEWSSEKKSFTEVVEIYTKTDEKHQISSWCNDLFKSKQSNTSVNADRSRKLFLNNQWEEHLLVISNHYHFLWISVGRMQLCSNILRLFNWSLTRWLLCFAVREGQIPVTGDLEGQRAEEETERPVSQEWSHQPTKWSL